MRKINTAHGVRYVAWLTKEEAELIQDNRNEEREYNRPEDTRPTCRYLRSFLTPPERCHLKTGAADGLCGNHRRMRERDDAEYFDTHYLTPT